MIGYTLKRTGRDEIMLGTDREAAITTFAEEILRTGLPELGGRLSLRQYWVASGRHGAQGLQMVDLVYFASNEGIGELDGSGVPSTVAAANLAADWAHAHARPTS